MKTEFKKLLDIISKDRYYSVILPIMLLLEGVIIGITYYYKWQLSMLAFMLECAILMILGASVDILLIRREKKKKESEHLKDIIMKTENSPIFPRGTRFDIGPSGTGHYRSNQTEDESKEPVVTPQPTNIETDEQDEQGIKYIKRTIWSFLLFAIEVCMWLYLSRKFVQKCYPILKLYSNNIFITFSGILLGLFMLFYLLLILIKITDNYMKNKPLFKIFISKNQIQ
jgi:hypothetical protein